MTRRVAAALAVSGLIALACSGPDAGRSSASPNPDSFDESPTAVIANAAIQDAQGKIVGLVSFREVRQGVRVDVKVTGLPDGTHGIHIHAVGKCDPPDFASAGGHFNPAGGVHGLPGTPTAHAGDLPNIVVGKDGKGTLLFYDPLISLNKAQSNGLTFGGGTAVIVHANVDDGKTDPAGNSGPRIACGIVKLANP